MSYLFGDSATAQRRLDILARTFQGPTREFLANFEPSGTDLALDLGCGPGHTTRLIADLLPFDKIVGLDKSSQFVSSASLSSPSRVSFINHDVTVVPFPIPSADLIFCRFLLPHLPNPMQALVSWASQLSNEGALLVEEVDWIHTDNPVLDSYLTTLARVLDAQGTALCAGAQLTNLLDDAPLKIASDGICPLPVSNRDAAAMFSMNIRAWGVTHPAISLYSTSFLQSLHNDLERMAEDAAGEDSDIEWGMRQIVLEPA